MATVDRRRLIGRLFTLPVAISAFAKNAFGDAVNSQAQDPNHEYKYLAVKVLRLINTAQLWYYHANNFYADMNQLVNSPVKEV